ncbi:hypothetical protein Y013_23705 [Rhodococcus pyridinivorans SB3094]|uniref:Uncharacterized protein n=1 Tax=Rhodococcus pyridinivorans SB3094 TaxID=1435356 RepID=V9XNI2_9NOCA|nr:MULTISPECIES: hypothetical protein [Rhodococcus]AHD23963.1 hypothetical protein Y013_23705 [Rhodococcus pyridinivorans SB3094]MCT7293927.1 hypothetical protein [Rhodococcus sp. PAE-6]MCZ1075633.1 hypothetical protein [Rhodococcus sp. A5(2022)]
METQHAESTSTLPLLNARSWALGFFVVAIALAVVASQFLIDFIASAH